jgi:hypothetical protein
MSRSALFLYVIVALGPAPSVARGSPPILAIEEIVTKRIALPPNVRQMLSEFLAARVAASRRFRVIPGPEVRQSLRELKREELSRCPGETCPIELGRALAASKVMAPEIIGLGARCLTILTIHDIKTATAEAAGTAQGKCDEASLALAFIEALARINRGPSPATAPSRERQPVGGRLVSVHFASFPLNQPVRIDGADQGKTPLRIDLVAGRRYRVSIGGQFPYGTFETDLIARDWQRVQTRLPLEPVHPLILATTPEWFGLGLGGGFLVAGSKPVFVFAMRLGVVKWRHFSLNLFDLSAAEGGERARQVTLGSRVGFPLHLGSSGKNQIVIWIGGSYDIANHPADGSQRSLFSLTPGLEYVRVLSNGTAFFGGELRGGVPVAGQLSDMERPNQVLLTLRFGISLSPILRRAK